MKQPTKTIPSIPQRNNPLVRISARIDYEIKEAKRDPLRTVRAVATFFGVAICAYLIFKTLQPRWMFTNTTTTGGDMGAHVWWPAYMRDVLLPQGRIFGWTMDNYAGFPAGQYYFPVPALMTIFLDFFMPYNVAFKITTAIGPITMPIAAYVLGRCLKASNPVPMLMAFAMTAFLYFTGDPRGGLTGTTLADYKNANFNQHIMGGPLLSNMAGEYAFSIAITFALLFLGVMYLALRDGKHRGLSAVLLALTVLSHLIVAIFVVMAVLIFWGALYASRKGYLRYVGCSFLVWIATVTLFIGDLGHYFFNNEGSLSLGLIVLVSCGVIAVMSYGIAKHKEDMKQVLHDAIPFIIGFLISAMWMIPLFTRFSFTSTMRYEKIVDLPSTAGINEVYELYLIPHYFLAAVFIPAAIGFILSATFLRKSIVPLLGTAITFAIVFKNWPEGHAWNLRFLPFWYIFIFFVAAVGYGEIARLPSALLSRLAIKNRDKKHILLRTSKITYTVLTVLLVVGFVIALVGFQPVGDKKSNANCRGGAGSGMFRDRRGYANCWAEYNFKGYEEQTAWPEFKSVIDAAKKLEPGRATWEQSDGSYGTTLAMTLLPYFTNHRIASMEGLYFEAAGTTAYHFLSVAEVSKSSSNAMRWPSCPKNTDGSKKDPNCFDSYYGTIADFTRGITHLKLLGDRYFFAHSPEAKAAAQADPELKLLKSLPDLDGANPLGWNIYEIKEHNLIEPLAVNPVVVTDKTDVKDWTQSGNKWLYDWWQKPGEYPFFVTGGPKGWDRQTAQQALAKPLSPNDQKKKSNVKVTDVKIKNDSISFHVDKVGVPVLVKVSYFPTFTAHGAKNIYRASPNFMIVVPTSHDVSLKVERDSVEWLSILLTLIGIGWCIQIAYGHRRFMQQLSARVMRKKVDSEA